MDAQVIVVGAGPAGAALAYLLATRGVDTLLIERQQDFAREFRGEVLVPAGVAALHEMGLGEALARVPQRVPSALEAYLNGRRFARVPLEPELFGGSPPVAVSQPGLLEMLIAEAGSGSRFAFERGASVRELLHEAGRVVGVRVRTGEGERTFRAPLLVGADGRASVVRRGCGLKPHFAPAAMDVVWCKLPFPAEDADTAPARFFLGRGHLLICYRSWDDLLQVGWVIEKGSYGELKSRGMDEWVEAMAEHVTPELGEHFRRHRGDATRPFVLDAALDRVRRWSVPGALLLGDAAHTMSPVGGQGINVALRDAIVAANELVPALGDGGVEALDAAALRVERERLPEIARIQALQAGPPRVAIGRNAGAALLRHAFAGLVRIPGAGALFLRAGRPFLLGVGDVQLRV